MPARLANITEDVTGQATIIGQQIRARRKELKVGTAAAAEAAGMSRVTWYRIEQGEPSVTFAAYLSAISVLGMKLKVVAPAASTPEDEAEEPHKAGWIPARIALADYPQLKQLAWQLQGVEHLSPREALGIYERNWRHLDLDALMPHEQSLIDALRLAFADEVRDV
ncbi:helix-turn-helix protein [Geothermobacter ehrlichii]|uniref:Helix-turn-helix protein n=1 Tax=Geothermobacter ehrlichii TaxID=213224 RepID=A0A5D3WPQ7_9BACT|nr:helix-turn-helix domain-containing protein [Geothermobacter ehrlichii]TYO99398.1 helix-turn-helix protein [Geothermobacter ehrlichii]